MPLKSINPATGEMIREFSELSDDEIGQKLQKAQETFIAWRQTSFNDRTKKMKSAAKVLRERKDELAAIMTSEVGKTIAASNAEIEKCAVTCEFYAENAEKFLSEETISTDASKSYVRFDPLGIVLAVMPWNFPLWQVFRFVAPALMAGNVGVLKHASNVQLSGEAIESVLLEAGFPSGSFQNLNIGSSKVEDLIRDSRVKAVTLTGSEYAGSQVAKQAGKAIKKTVLELGGSDPFIVLKDADIEMAAKTAVAARLQANAGQSCIAAKRFIVDNSVINEFTKQLVMEVNNLVVGDPKDPKTDVGPLVNEQAVMEIHKQVEESIKRGAKLLAGGQKGKGNGFFYQPTVLSEVKKGMPVYDEEVFGPVIPVIGVKDDDEAVFVANDSSYGLGATIFSRDTNKAEKLAMEIESGGVFINNMVKSDARLPFGGIKKSGYGRELSSYGIKEFVNIKTIWVK